MLLFRYKRGRISWTCLLLVLVQQKLWTPNYGNSFTWRIHALVNFRFSSREIFESVEVNDYQLNLSLLVGEEESRNVKDGLISAEQAGFPTVLSPRIGNCYIRSIIGPGEHTNTNPLRNTEILLC